MGFGNDRIVLHESVVVALRELLPRQRVVRYRESRRLDTCVIIMALMIGSVRFGEAMGDDIAVVSG